MPKLVTDSMPCEVATRAERTRDEVTLGGRRIVLQRPRVRSATEGELTLPSFAFAAGRDPLDARTLEAIVSRNVEPRLPPLARCSA